MRLWPSRAWLLALAATSLAGAGRAQSVGVRFVAVDVEHQLLGGLLGAAVVGSIPLTTKGLRITISAEHVAGSSRRVGVPCGGLVNPETCRPEPIQDRGSATTVSVGLAFPVASTGQLEFLLGGNLGGAYVRSRSRGLTNGARLSASNAMWRLDGTAEGLWRPRRNWPITVGAGFAVGWLAPIGEDRTVDGYTPFNVSSEVAGVWIGLSLSLGR